MSSVGRREAGMQGSQRWLHGRCWTACACMPQTAPGCVVGFFRCFRCTRSRANQINHRRVPAWYYSCTWVRSYIWPGDVLRVQPFVLLARLVHEFDEISARVGVVLFVSLVWGVRSRLDSRSCAMGHWGACRANETLSCTWSLDHCRDLQRGASGQDWSCDSRRTAFSPRDANAWGNWVFTIQRADPYPLPLLASSLFRS